jgi:two-component system cell cycle sensor histidine kinase/response regulator CckA
MSANEHSSDAPSQAAELRPPLSSSHDRRDWRDGSTVRITLTFALAYWICADLGAFLSARSTYISFWLPAGLYVAALLTHERRRWPALVLGGLLGNWIFDLRLGTPVLAIAGFSAINTVQALTGAWLAQRFVARRPRLATMREFLGLMAATAVAAPALGALLGAALLQGQAMGPPFWRAWQVWWGGSAMAAVLILPVVLAWSAPPRPSSRGWSPSRLLEAALLVATLVGATYYMLVLDSGILAPYKSRLYPLLLWASIRFGLRGATATNLLLALLMALFTTQVHKGLSPEDLATGSYVFSLQTFLAVGAVVGILPALALAERDRTLAHLRLSEGRLRNLTAAGFEGVAISEDGRIVDVNDQLTQMLRLSREQMLGRHLYEFSDPSARPGIADAIKNGHDHASEHRVVRHDGTVVYFEVQARSLREGQHVVRLAALRDVTERKQFEEALEREHRQLEAIVDAAMDGIITVDEGERIVVFNRAAQHIFRCSAEAAVDESLARFIPDFRRARDAGYLRRIDSDAVDAAAPGPGPFAALRGRRRAGGPSGPVEDFPLEASLSEIEVSGQRLFTVTCRDVSDRAIAEETRQRLEAQLRQAQKMEAIGTLAGGIAHDFNNILGVILGNVAIARMDVPSDHPAEESLREIDRAGRRATQLVQQILMFSRQQEASRRAIALAGPIGDTLKMLRSTLPAQVELEAKLGEDVPIVLADPTQVHQILLNLCTNAWHALEGKPGRITVETAALTVGPGQSPAGESVPPGRYARLSVSDDGTGMGPEVMDRAFEPFFTTKAPGRGTGLGLSVVHGIVKDHGGLISVTSRVGVGTTFQILLPEAAALVEASLPAPPALSRGQGQHVLYLDDEAPLVELTRRLLGRMGYRTSGFTQPVEALDAVRTDPESYDLVLTDFNMPGMSGVEVAKTLAIIRPDLPVILASGYITEELRTNASHAGVRHLIYKPNTVEELCAVVHRLVGQEAPRQ